MKPVVPAALLILATAPIVTPGAPAIAGQVAARGSAALLTRDQRAVETLAIALRKDPGVQAARAQARAALTTTPSYRLAGAPEMLDGALDEVVYVALRATAADDPANPKVIWTSQPPYDFGALHVPGARVTGDNPDRIYRTIAASPAYRYEIRGRVQPEPGNGEFSFEAIPTPSLGGTPKANLNSRLIDVAADGSFTITADATPAAGRRNHLELPAGTRTILVRDTLADWNHQLPNQLVVRRIDSTAAEPRSQAGIAAEAAREVASLAANHKTFIGYAWMTPVNTLVGHERTASAGVPGSIGALSRFSLKSDEALLVTIAPADAAYVGLQVTDSWYRSLPTIDRTSSLSSRQVVKNADGSITFVIAPRDPGVANWLDTSGLGEGLMMLRVEDFPGKLPVPASVIRETRVVKRDAIPADLPRMTTAERARQQRERKAGFARRLVIGEPTLVVAKR